MPDSKPPPSMQIPLRSGGNFPYIVGSVVLCVLIGVMLAWKLKNPETPAPSTLAIPSVTGAPPPPLPMHAPPPPPPPEEQAPDAGLDAGVPRPGMPPPLASPGPCGNCGEGSKSSPGLEAALRAAAQSARACYNRALQRSEVSGSMAVVVQVASNGSICSASITNDSVRSNEIGSCVLGKFRGKMFPPPQSGCVVVTIPITFTFKQ